MGADKNSSPKRELGLCPKFTIKDSHTSLPRSRSRYRPTNPRNKLQTIPKQKHESRSKGLSNSMRHQADSHGDRADGPRVTDGQSEKGSRPSSSTPQITDSPHPILGRSASNRCRADGPPNTSWPKTAGQPDHSRTRDEHKEP
jgi:hypothetical protein